MFGWQGFSIVICMIAVLMAVRKSVASVYGYCKQSGLFFSVRNRKPLGFSTIELMVVMSIMLVFMKLAAPSFAHITQTGQLSGIQSEFMAALSLARNEAVKRGVPVAVGAVSSVAGNEFGAGWRVWVDTNNNGQFDSGETIIKARAALPNYITLGGGGTTAIAFSSKGYLSSSSIIQLKLCHSGVNSDGYQFIVQYNGLADVSGSISCS